MVSVENFLYEVNDEIWIDLSCLVLSDPHHKINLQTFSQPTNVEAGYVERLRAGTGDNYPKQWSGFAVTTGKHKQSETSSNTTLSIAINCDFAHLRREDLLKASMHFLKLTFPCFCR